MLLDTDLVRILRRHPVECVILNGCDSDKLAAMLMKECGVRVAVSWAERVVPSEACAIMVSASVSTNLACVSALSDM